jgi:hypothetical protein
MNSASRMCARNGAVLVAAVCLLASATYAGAPTTLTNGVAVSGLSGALGSDAFYQIVVPSGQDTLEIVTSGGTGDVDLYVKQGAQPTITSYDYRSWNNGNSETVDVNKPTAGTWYITLHGYATYSGVTLKATYTGTTKYQPLTSGVAVTGLAGATNDALYYTIAVPAGQSKLDISISGGTGDADLYVKRGALPTLTVYDYRPFLSGNNEAVSIDNPAADTWYIMVQGGKAFSGDRKSVV